MRFLPSRDSLIELTPPLAIVSSRIATACVHTVRARFHRFTVSYVWRTIPSGPVDAKTTSGQWPPLTTTSFPIMDIEKLTALLNATLYTTHRNEAEEQLQRVSILFADDLNIIIILIPAHACTLLKVMWNITRTCFDTIWFVLMGPMTGTVRFYYLFLAVIPRRI